MFKVNNKNTGRTSWRCFGVFIVNFENISQLFSSVSIVNFEQVNVSCVFWELLWDFGFQVVGQYYPVMGH